MIRDPRPRRDGTCVVCRGERKQPPPKSLLPNLAAELRRDPFCSTACCRAWNGVK